MAFKQFMDALPLQTIHPWFKKILQSVIVVYFIPVNDYTYSKLRAGVNS
ncbi:MAG: hypothetical protein JST09_21860 [Bacteroidetes bacterium]|nr:hypothetical protein [Bacteroidota bacterium]MBS1610647.1 hypothetical protein [Bacteroidota bacterium]